MSAILAVMRNRRDFSIKSESLGSYPKYIMAIEEPINAYKTVGMIILGKQYAVYGKTTYRFPRICNMEVQI